jgi:hypothetical protein
MFPSTFWARNITQNDAGKIGPRERDKILLPVLCYVADMSRLRPFVGGTA